MVIGFEVYGGVAGMDRGLWAFSLGARIQERR